MNIKFNTDETYRDDYTFANSPETIARAPFPFPDDDYMYSMNLEPHVSVGDGAFRAAGAKPRRAELSGSCPGAAY